MASLKTLLSFTTFLLCQVVFAENATPDSTTDADIPAPSDYCSTALYHINLHRANHSAPALVWNQALADQAANSINGCQAGIPDDSGGNSAKFWGTGRNPYSEAQITSYSIESWYSEMYEYREYTDDFTLPPDPNRAWFYDILHFTQMVWQSQTSVGCYAVECGPNTPLTLSLSEGGTYWDWAWNIFCDFGPGGNIISPDLFPQNVLPPIGLSDDDANANIDDSACSF